MWGNRLGWMISAGIVVLTIGIYAMVLMGAGISPPTAMTTKAGAMDPLTLPGIPRAAVPTGSGDATSYYQDAIAAYKADPDAYKSFDKNGKMADAKKLSAIDAILKASTAASTGKIFAPNPSAAVIHGGKRYEAVKPIEVPGRCVLRIANMYMGQKKPDEARKYYEAAFNLGYAMYTERLTYPEFEIGAEFMRVSALQLGKMDKDKAEQMQLFYDDTQTYLTGLKDNGFPTLFNPANRRAVDEHSGDVFNLAQHSNERMWKIEAILMLGHYKYFATHAGDQRGATKVLAQMAADDTLDPAVKAAVKASQDLTLADHNMSAQMK